MIPLLCRWRLHRWKQIDVGISPVVGFVYLQECRRCHQRREAFWV
jgi:hypothetical protein